MTAARRRTCRFSPMSIHERSFRTGPPPKTRVGVSDEWYLLLPNPFQHVAFGLGPGLHQAFVRFGPALLAARLIAVRAIRHPVAGDRVQQLLIDAPAELRVVFPLRSNHRLERFPRLHRSLEADRSR